MELKEYTRKTFPVKAIEVTLENIEEVAEWCKGTIEKVPTKMMGAEAMLPVINIAGQGVNQGQTFVASLGCFVVGLGGNFRVYKPIRFAADFNEVVKEKPIELVAPSEDELAADQEPLPTKNSGYTMIPGDPSTFQKVI
jgi:hypothetical protein